MKMMLGNTPVKSLNIHHFEMDTNSATVQPSDLQAGITCFARGQKVTGTGKCFSFATYGGWKTNESDSIPTVINTVQICSVDYPVRMLVSMTDTHFCDFTTPQEIAEITIDGATYPITISVQNGEFFISCEKTVNIQLFIGKDEYI